MAILDLQRFLKALAQENVEFLLVGGVAAIGHGMNYATDDLDICHKRTDKNLDSLVRALLPSNPRLRIVATDPLPFLFDAKTLKSGINFTLQTDWGNIDLLGEVQGMGTYDQLLLRAVPYEFYGITVKTISLDDLIRAKQIAGRTKDKLHLLELEAIREIRKGK